MPSEKSMNPLKHIQNIRDKVSRFSGAEILRQKLKGKNMEEVKSMLVNELNVHKVKPEFTLKNSNEGESIRERLNTESGLIIGNHPELYEINILLSILDRNDVLFITSEEGSRLKNLPVGDNILPIPQNTTEGLAFFRKIREHLNKKGLVVLYPGGVTPINRIDFEDAFRIIVEKILKPEQMIYMLDVRPKINPENLTKVKNSRDFRDEEDRLPIIAEEQYTRAETWKKITESNKDSKYGKNEASWAFNDYYMSQFPDHYRTVDESSTVVINKKD